MVTEGTDLISAKPKCQELQGRNYTMLMPKTKMDTNAMHAFYDSYGGKTFFFSLP